MQNPSDQNQTLYQELVREKQAEQKESTVRTYGLISMIYMYLGEQIVNYIVVESHFKFWLE